ncbi:MAG: tRNA (adenosine(37)-N6)-threonylcarbamoyltransferase complex ATPase subunit type 1 TsaE [Desulfobacterales bacterium]|nr:tRNA (adenosine(37)-N6)-threonylcarbamoyltransferase complex ATPase subunit type 1 TsaE [Desulfobacterales bacterium]
MPTDNTEKITSHTPQETEQLGSLLGSMLAKGDIIALCGELGTGKTTFVRGMARGMGLEETEVASPSFTLVNEYEGPLRLFHIDLYRLEDEKELLGIDYEEYIKGDGVVVIEWANRIPQAVPRDALWITLRYLGADCREVALRAQGDRYTRMIEELQRKVYTDNSL